MENKKCYKWKYLEKNSVEIELYFSYHLSINIRNSKQRYPVIT